MKTQTLLIILINLVSGTILLLAGVDWMGQGLEKANRSLLEKVMANLTGKTWRAFLAGTFLTALIQSSTAVTVLTVGLVNSGIMKLSQAVGIILGANIGTTVTAQLISFPISHISIPALIIGIGTIVLSRRPTIRSIGQAITGIGFLFAGLMVLNASIPYVRDNPKIQQLFLHYGGNPFISLFIGMIATALVHSSSATVGLTILLYNAGLLPFEGAVALVLGDNIGTCITAQLAGLKGNIAAKRTVWAHTLYNIIGVIIAFTFLKPFANLVENITTFLGMDQTRLVANSHTLFNILSAVLFLPLIKFYVKFIEWVVPE
ncbi:MAG: Na/Pi cotransporter family protein [Clostridia bacterium]